MRFSLWNVHVYTLCDRFSKTSPMSAARISILWNFLICKIIHDSLCYSYGPSVSFSPSLISLLGDSGLFYGTSYPIYHCCINCKSNSVWKDCIGSHSEYRNRTWNTLFVSEITNWNQPKVQSADSRSHTSWRRLQSRQPCFVWCCTTVCDYVHLEYGAAWSEYSDINLLKPSGNFTYHQV
jgi:hypothetical protein